MGPFPIVLGVISSIDTLRKVIIAIQEARQFDKRCAEIGRMVAMLLTVIGADNITDNGSSPVAPENQLLTTGNIRPAAQNAVEEVRMAIAELHKLIVKCTTQGTLQRGWEIFMGGKIAQAKQMLFEWITVCMMECTMKTGRDVRNLTDAEIEKLDGINVNLEKLLTKSDRIAQQQIQNYKLLEKEIQQQDKDEIVAVQISFHRGDPRLKIIGKENSSGYSAVLQDVGPVICKEIKSDEIREGWGSRHAEIYRCISKGTLVQSFYGIAELDGIQYAVMEDLRNDQTLAAAIESHDFEPLARIRFAYELANTVAYLHSVGIIIKNLSDINVVVIKLGGGRPQPRLVNLEQARTLVEATAFESYDIRFEAPEYKRENTHSKYTDLWSLGVLIWQWVTRTFPFSTSPSSLPEKQEIIQKQLADGDFTWADGVQAHNMGDVYTIVRGCWNLTPEMRPQAAYIAQRLLDLYARCLTNDHSSSTTELSEEVKDSVLRRIEAKRKHHSAEPVPSHYVSMLHDAVTARNDPLSSFLLGAAIWWELVSTDTLKPETEYIDPMPPVEVRRARMALSFLENAIDAGLDIALREIGLAYAQLAKYYVNAARRR